jgi:hypothetical protein
MYIPVSPGATTGNASWNQTEFIHQHDEKEKQFKAEIDSLRTTIADFECKERARLKARIEALREKTGRYAVRAKGEKG